jgi:autotransporter translocation and assembly factor TamB
MMRSWMWIARYALVLLVALLLGAALAELSVFKQTTLGTPKLTAVRDRSVPRLQRRAHRVLDPRARRRASTAQRRRRLCHLGY